MYVRKSEEILLVCCVSVIVLIYFCGYLSVCFNLYCCICYVDQL